MVCSISRGGAVVARFFDALIWQDNFRHALDENILRPESVQMSIVDRIERLACRKTDVLGFVNRICNNVKGFGVDDLRTACFSRDISAGNLNSVATKITSLSETRLTTLVPFRGI